MKYLISSILIGLFVTAGYAQSNDLAKVQKLVKSFNTEEATSDLKEAHEVIQALFAKDDYQPTAQSHYMYAMVESLVLKNLDVDEPLALSESITSHYSKALEMDKERQLRKDILRDVYQAKISMTEYGRESYEEEDYKMAHSHYCNAVGLNELEVAYPRYVSVDTSMMFTSAVFASLAKKNKVALTEFEKIEAMGYERKDLYDYLITLYTEEGMEKKAEAMRVKKSQKYPE